MAKSDYFENAVLNVLRGQSITAPTTLYVGLASSATADSNTGATAPELAAINGYARQPVTFTAPSGGTNNQVTNSGAINFSANGGDWATASYFFVTDSLSVGTGNILYHGPLTTPVTVLDGQTRQFPVGALVVRES